MEIGGEPMVVRVWKRCRQASGFDGVVVATDSEEIGGVCEAHGVEWYMTPVDLRNGTERCAYLADMLPKDAIVVNVQGDEPLMDPVIPQRVLFNLRNKPDRVWTVVRKSKGEEDDRRDVVKCWVQGGEIKEWTRSKARWAKHVHIGVYGYSVGRLREYVAKKPSPDEEKEGLEQSRWREPLCCFTVDYVGRGERPIKLRLS